MKQTVALVIATAALAAPASALGAPQLAAPIPVVHPAQTSTTGQQYANLGPDRKALNAYANYLTTILDNASIAQAGDTAYIATVSSVDGCKSALEPLTQPSDQVDTELQHTLMALGEEMGDDLSITYDQTALPAFSKFSTTLLRLHWTRTSGALLVVKHYVDDETAVLEMLPSELCEDTGLAGADPQKVPDGTKAFVKSYEKASTAANLALANLMKLLQSYEVPAEKNLITRIANLASQVATTTKSDLLQSGSSLTTVLETT